MQVFQESCNILARYDFSVRFLQNLPFLSEPCKIYIFHDCLARFLQDMFFFSTRVVFRLMLHSNHFRFFLDPTDKTGTLDPNAQCSGADCNQWNSSDSSIIAGETAAAQKEPASGFKGYTNLVYLNENITKFTLNYILKITKHTARGCCTIKACLDKLLLIKLAAKLVEVNV